MNTSIMFGGSSESKNRPKRDTSETTNIDMPITTSSFRFVTNQIGYDVSHLTFAGEIRICNYLFFRIRKNN